ncbi:MAG: sodium:solute symporter [Bryobacterales bacterium]|nr:sodium:solute symporter [Bryobacterales bacterium]
MRPLDWVVLAVSLIFVVAYGMWKSRRNATMNEYLLAGQTMPWYAMALSIMATQASAITFISTTGQAYTDGMRFVQFYFGLPLAMILISMTAVPIFHRTKVYTAYEYLERRFDAKTRALVSTIFLIQRGLAVGVALYAPAIVLTVIFGWPDRWTTLLMGTVVVAYTTFGGIKAVTWTDFQQMIVMLIGLIVSLVVAVSLLPAEVSFTDALRLAGAAGRLNAVVTSFDWNDRYNVWNGLLGGMFLALAYFGCDQSQVQRYLTGKSVTQSRLSLLFNAVAKIPMQFAILLVGAIVFVFYIFEKPPIVFHQQEMARIEQRAGFAPLAQRFDKAFEARRSGAREFLESGNPLPFQQAHGEMERVRKEAAAGVNDTNYIFLGFVTRYLPAGMVGLIMAAIFAAAMSTISAEINSLATVSVIDIYRRFWNPGGSDAHMLAASRIATVFWGAYAVGTASFGRNLGSLIEAVNMLGSLFYGSLLGVFVLAFFFRRVGGNAAFTAVLVGQTVIFALFKFTGISFLWYNVIGSLVVVAVGLALSTAAPQDRAAQHSQSA